MKFDQLYQQLMEAMSRRNFLGLMGKGAAAAGLAPKGMIGKTLMNTAIGKPISFDEAISNHLDAVFNNNETSTAGTIKATIKSYSTLLSSLQEKGLATPHLTSEINDIISMLSPAAYKDFKAQGGGNIEDFHTAIVEDGADWKVDEQIYKIAADNNLLSQAARDKFKENMGQDINEYKTFTPEEKKKQQEKEEQDRQDYHTKQFAKSINYSRADKAGGSEDEGYAKYYESKKN